MLRATPPPRWLWIGNSNTRPFVTEFDNEFRKFKLCKKSEHYKGEIDSTPDNCDNLTFSGIDTIIADLGKNKTAEELEAELDKIFSTLESYCLQGMKGRISLPEATLVWLTLMTMTKMKETLSLLRNGFQKTCKGFRFSQISGDEKMVCRPPCVCWNKRGP